MTTSCFLQISKGMGMNMTTAFNIFLRQSVRLQKLPFEISLDLPNIETIEAIKEGSEIIKSGKSRFDNADDMFTDLGI